MKKHLQAIFFILILFNLSCTSYKNVPYFQNSTPDGVFLEKITNFSALTIQPGDLLAIHVNSLSHEADAAINYNLSQTIENDAGNSLPANRTEVETEQTAVAGYLVDPQGYINLPLAGPVKVGGLSTAEITVLLESTLSEFLSQPKIQVRIMNFKISVLGDVKSPGNFAIQNERINILEALALAGDLNVTGIRTNVLLIREIDGMRQYIPIDLTSINAISSPYYYLKNHDVIYVRPNRDKVASTDSAFQKVSLLIAALSLLAIFLTRGK